MTKFNVPYPENIPATHSPFATICQWRTPQFKVHRTLGLAKTAMSYHKYSTGAIYYLVGNAWVKVFEKPELNFQWDWKDYDFENVTNQER